MGDFVQLKTHQYINANNPVIWHRCRWLQYKTYYGDYEKKIFWLFTNNWIYYDSSLLIIKYRNEFYTKPYVSVFFIIFTADSFIHATHLIHHNHFNSDPLPLVASKQGEKRLKGKRLLSVKAIKKKEDFDCHYT